MKLLITGGAGYIGNLLVEYLLKNNHEVVVLDNLMYKQTSLLHLCHNPKLTFVYGDVRDDEFLRKCADGVDVIIPLAAIVGAPACDKDQMLAFDVNYRHI